MRIYFNKQISTYFLLLTVASTMHRGITSMRVRYQHHDCLVSLRTNAIVCHKYYEHCLNLTLIPIGQCPLKLTPEGGVP